MFISRVITRREGKNPRFRGRSIVWRVYKPTQVWGKQQTKELKFQREVEKKIVIVEGRFPRKMVRSSSDAKARQTKATTSQQGKQTGVKRGKTPDQKAKHNASCRKHRKKIKIQNNQTREECERMTKELEEKNSELLRFQNEMQKYKGAVEEQMAQMRQFLTSLNFEGQSFSTSEQISEYCLSRTYEPHHQGVLESGAASSLENYDEWFEDLLKSDAAPGVPDFGAGSSFHANVDVEFFDWMEKFFLNAAAADISQTKNSVVEIHNNDLVNQIDHNAMVQRCELSPAQRSAENERDRQHMPEYKIKPELKRLRNMVVKYEEIAPLFNTISQLAEESKQMNNTEPNLARRIQEIDNIFCQHIQEMHNKSFDHGSESSHTVMYTA